MTYLAADQRHDSMPYRRSGRSGLRLPAVSQETMGALDAVVRSGKALYVGISNYNSEQTARAAAILRDLGTPLLINQPSYSMLNRWTEADGLLDTLAEVGAGCIACSSLAQGLLTDRYLGGIPADSRVRTSVFWAERSFVGPHR